MADISDVCNMLVNTISYTLWSSPTPGIAQTTGTNGLVVVARDEPSGNEIDSALKNQISYVTVCPMVGMQRLTTRFINPVDVVYTVPVTLTTNVSINHCTFGGNATSGQMVGIGVGKHGYAYACNSTDNTVTIATNMASIIPNATSNASTITLPTDLFSVNVVGNTTINTEVRRQKAVFEVTVWSYDPDVLDSVASIVDLMFASTRAFLLPDGSYTNIPEYFGSDQRFGSERADLFRRILRYTIEYPTIVTTILPSLLFTGGNIANVTTWGNI
jgi:hypothetical protein